MQSIEFYNDVKTMCDIAGQPALAESIIKLHKAYNEAIDFDKEFGDYYSDLREEEAEQDAESENYKEMTEEGVQGILNKLGLTVVNKWYDGNRSRPVFDCRKDNGETICVWTEPPYDSLEHELNAILDEIHEEELNAAAEKISAPDYHAEGAYEDLTDIGGDFEAVEFYKDVQAVCDIAGKPALAEAVIKLHKAYNPVMEAGEAKPHVIPEEIAIAVNNAQAEDYGWRPETAEREFNETWDWLEDHADTVLDAWNTNNDPREVVRAIEDDEENLACRFDGI